MMTPKSNSNLVNKSIIIFLTIAVPILLAVTSIRLVMSYQFIQFEYQRSDFPIDTYGFTTEDRLKYFHHPIDYLLNGEDISFLEQLRLPAEVCWQPPPNATDCPMYEEAALRHMVDVKVITEITYLTAFIIFLITLSIFGLSYRNTISRSTIRRGLTYGATLTLGIIVVIVTLAVTAWDFFFDKFHELLFEEGTWRFAFSDTLIRLYPEKFWFDASITIGIFTTIGAIIIVALVWRWSKYNP